jgi:hypothetical protein
VTNIEGDSEHGTPTPDERTEMTSVESLFPRLEPLLPRVSKPIQYVGGELNARSKQWDSVDVHWAPTR